MSITPQDARQALQVLRGSGIASLKEADPNVWALVLNTIQAEDSRGVPITQDGRPVLLDPTAAEVHAAAVRLAGQGVAFPTTADLARQVQAGREGDRATRRARVADDVAQHGAWIPQGLADDVPAELAARRAYTAAIGGGATRAQAQAHAWRSIGRTPPALEAGRDRSADVLALIASLPQRAA